MGKSIGVIITVMALVAGMIIGWNIKPAQQSIPQQTISSKPDTSVTVVVHDTIKQIVRRKDIVLHVDTVVMMPDSSGTDSIATKSNCISFDTTEKNGTYIKASVCSKMLPTIKPDDIFGEIQYLPGPDSVRTVIQKQTIRVEVKEPFYKDWKTYVMAVFAAAFIFAAAK